MILNSGKRIKASFEYNSAENKILFSRGDSLQSNYHKGEKTSPYNLRKNETIKIRSVIN
jgi:hypothetical protein